ncbi:hypothetical protein [Leucobacter sp. cx-169]|uniref:hypothetical protein n=1 Tax=Leucobacter sp. cx-169 TaxID=2770549 RepID=UPI00165D7B04|nr:hypothetical protein [Leucobacter sp. cx-169]MBC9927250.1 hypothetical protein [Leucobacter sp. cx-169]
MTIHIVELPRLVHAGMVPHLCSGLPQHLNGGQVELRCRALADGDPDPVARAAVEEIVVRRHGSILVRGASEQFIAALTVAANIAKTESGDGAAYVLVPQDPEDMVFRHGGVTVTLGDLIAHLERIPESRWRTGTVRSEDGRTNCFFGHLHHYGVFMSSYAATLPEATAKCSGEEVFASRLWDWFESTWATTYRIYPVNDGESLKYPQPNPKSRVLAFLAALRSGAEPNTTRSLDAEYLHGEHVACCSPERMTS